MHLEGNCTTQDACAYIVYIANEVEPNYPYYLVDLGDSKTYQFA